MSFLYSVLLTMPLSGEQTPALKKKEMDAVTQAGLACSEYPANLQQRPPSKHDFSHAWFFLSLSLSLTLTLSLCLL